MSVRIKDDTAILVLQTARNASLGLRYLTDEIQQIADPKTPMNKGYLRRNVLKTVIGLSAKVKWRQRYASIQEGGKGIKNYTTSGTGPHFAENAVARVAKSPEGAFKKARLV